MKNWTIMGCSIVTKVHKQVPGFHQHFLRTVYKFSYILWILSLLASTATAQNFDFPPTMFTQQPQAGSIEVQGNTKVLLCYANGIPPPVYRWKKDGRYLSPGNVTETSLKIQNIQRSEAGEYQCLASNTQGAILSNRVHVHVAYMVPFANAGNQEKSVDQGQSKVIDLPPIDSYPAPSVRWFEGYGMPIRAESQRYHVTLKNQLVILETRLNADNNKLFKATALNSYTGQSSDSQTFVLKVQNVGDLVNDIPPEIVIPPTHTTAVQGDDAAVKLECVSNARPLNYLSLNWFKKSDSGERILIEPDNLKYLLSMYRRVLTIKNPVIDDSGTYICEATFNRPGGPSLPSAAAQANLTIHVKPNFATAPPSEISQDVGTTIEIPCQAVGIPAPAITWFRNGANIISLPKERYSISESGNLQIRDAGPEDSGMYQCFVSNRASEMNAATWVRVLSSPPEIIRKPYNQSIIAGDNAQFACEVSGAPRPDISWYRVTVGGVTEDLPNGRIQVREDGLLIPISQVSDSGRYVCNATNNKGADVATAWLTVTLRTRIVAPPQDASVIKGSTFDIQCGVSNDPTVRVNWHWHHNSNPIPANDDRREVQGDGRLKITSVRNDDIGQYRCDVVSTGGNDTASANIKVIELPYRPSITAVELNPQSNRAADVQWSPGFDGHSPIKKFVVQYRLVASSDMLPNEGWIVADKDVPFEQRTFTVRDLQPARSYQFRVSAVNDVGEGPPSDPSQVIELPQQPPSGPPRGVVGSPRSNSSIIIQWQPPDEDKWNGNLLGYIMSYKLSGYPDETLQHENITNYLVTMYELKRLIVFQEYEIAVAAYNKKGVGVYSDYMQVRTQEGRPTESPTNVQAIPVNSTAIKLTWMPPDPQYINGINQGYKISAGTVNGDGEGIDIVVHSNTSNMLGQQTGHLRGLMKYTQYRIAVLCFTSKGDGPSTTPVVARTMEDVPGPVGNLRFDNILDTSLRVLWDPPVHINGELTGYTLSYMKKNQTITKVTKELNAGALNYTIRGLTATTVYTIEVFAKTRKGPGPPSSADMDSGVPPETPEAPRNLAITNILADSVHLQFDQGFSGHTSISKWIVEAQMRKQTSALNNRRRRQSDEEWEEIFSISAPEAEAITVSGLAPYTRYRMRMLAENIAGQSPPSDVTRWFDTLQAPPAAAPKEVTVRAVNETAQRVRWTPLNSDEWNGEQRGYRIQFKTHEESVFVKIVLVSDENANSHVLSDLEEYTKYDVRVAAYNKVGYSPYSPVTSDTTRESVPSGGPANVTAIAQSSTSILVTWSEVPKPHQNGEIRGYKINYKSSQANIPDVQKVIDSAEIRQTRLIELRKFVWYEIQVSAFTRIGDGVLSAPPIEARTHEDVPGPPASVYFPEVDHNSAKVVWSPPREPNGFIIGYRVAYREKADPPAYAIVDDSLNPGRRDFYVSNLERNTYYVFTVTARTQLGWGIPAELEVYTIVNRRVPLPPTRPSIGPSQIGRRSVTINWQPGNDGYGPIRNFTIQIQKDDDEFDTIPEYVEHNISSYAVTGLRPDTKYRFRIAAYNDIGLSPYSTSSEQVTTKLDAPESPPIDLKVIPKTTTSVLVSWKPPGDDTWNGDKGGYRVWYAQLRYALLGLDESYQQVDVIWPSTETTLANLVEEVVYEVKVTAFNGIGDGPSTGPYDIYVGEAVPMASPETVDAETKSSTEITLTWRPPPLDEQNGDLLGYKIFYWITANRSSTETTRTVASTENDVVLDGLRVFTEYSFLMLAFNAAGDGPNTTVAVTAMTAEGVPDQPGRLTFVVTSLSSLNVSWSMPSLPNGVIEQFELSYYQESLIDGESRSVQVKLSGDKIHYLAKELEENVRYVFSVKAKTAVAWGPPRVGNVTIGPQPGSPGEPSQPLLTTVDNSVKMSWSNGAPGDSPINGYIIQGIEKQGNLWDTMQNKADIQTQALISFFDLKPKTEYQFRVIAMNAKGISPPSQPSEFVTTIDVDEKPFYQQWWFLVIVALVGVILIIIVISLLCLTGHRRKNKKYKGRSAAADIANAYKGSAFPSHGNNGLPRTLVQLSEPSSSNEGQDGGGFHTFETRASARRSQRPRPPRNNTLPPYSNPAFRSPPRPSPGSVNYSDTEDVKAYGGDDSSSSITEKPSECSSSREGSQCSDSEPESEKEAPPPFNGTYVSNGDVRQSWKRQGPYANGNGSAYNYTDSEQESQYGITMNGGHIIMNNMAGSRAPLPGFSSFV